MNTWSNFLSFDCKKDTTITALSAVFWIEIADLINAAFMTSETKMLSYNIAWNLDSIFFFFQKKKRTGKATVDNTILGRKYAGKYNFKVIFYFIREVKD